MTDIRTRRLRALAELIRSASFGSQEEVTAQLNKLGYPVTQATVSRDLEHLGAVKVKRGGILSYALAEQMAAADWSAGRLERILAEWALSVEAAGPLFRRFSPEALRALGASSRAAASLDRPAIGPAHLALGALEADEDLRERTGLTALRLRMLSSGLDEDTTPLPERRLPGDERLRELLGALPAAAETLDVLGWMLAHGSEELTSLLRRQKVTPALFERCRGAFHDPELLT